MERRTKRHEVFPHAWYNIPQLSGRVKESGEFLRRIEAEGQRAGQAL